MNSKQIHDVIIIGAGPAGLTAAVYIRRADINVLILESNAPGGKIVKTAEIENWPGSINISGPDLAYNMYEQAMNLKAVYQYGDVVYIIDHQDYKEIKCSDGNIYYTKTILIATGTQERKMNVPGEDKYLSKGVSYCAVCDGALFKDKVVTVVGGGNSALEEAIYLTKFASKVNIVIRRDVFRADKIIQDKIQTHPKIDVITKVIPHEVVGDNVVTGLVVKNVDTKELTTIPTDGVFPFIGLDPVSAFAKNLGITDDKGYIIVNDKMETKIPGIYSAGDVNETVLRQIVTATSDGAIAAQQIIHYLEEKAV